MVRRASAGPMLLSRGAPVHERPGDVPIWNRCGGGWRQAAPGRLAGWGNKPEPRGFSPVHRVVAVFRPEPDAEIRSPCWFAGLKVWACCAGDASFAGHPPASPCRPRSRQSPPSARVGLGGQRRERVSGQETARPGGRAQVAGVEGGVAVDQGGGQRPRLRIRSGHICTGRDRSGGAEIMARSAKLIREAWTWSVPAFPRSD